MAVPSMLCACERGKRGLAAEGDVLGIQEAKNLACKGVTAGDQKGRPQEAHWEWYPQKCCGGGDAQF